MRMLFILALLPAPAFAESSDLTSGQKTAIFNCGRCHVVPGGNPFGSIGSTPSFAVMRNYPDWRARFEAFYTEPPHIAVTQIEGVTQPFDPGRPPPIAPMVLSEAEVISIIDFVETITPRDVGTVQ